MAASSESLDSRGNPELRSNDSASDLASDGANASSTSLTRRELRRRETLAALEPVPETRRQRRERELAALAETSAEAGQVPATAVADNHPTDIRPTDNHPATGSVATTIVTATPVTGEIPVEPAPTPLTAEIPAEPVAARPAASRPVPSRAHGRPLGRLGTHPAHNHPPHTHKAPRRRAARVWIKTVVMVTTAGLTAMFCMPAYAQVAGNGSLAAGVGASANIDPQSLTVAAVKGTSSGRDTFSVQENAASFDSTMQTTVSPTVQALAAKLMADVAAGRLTGSVPDHIPEIRNLANGWAVPGCGVDYRVLQTIDVALQNFATVGVSDINRRCTGQIEGAGTESAHYANGGGHAVDFFLLDGQPLTGGDAQSMKLMRILDPLVPPETNVGQAECRASMSLVNLVPFDDTCNHLHIDFGTAQGASLKRLPSGAAD